MPIDMYVREGCPFSKKATDYVETFPEKLRSQIHVSQIDFRNRPPNVTRVPTIITQQGDTLVGADVFAYLKRWRYDAVPPGTAEAFAAISSNKIVWFLLCLAIVAVGLYFYRKRGGRIPGLPLLNQPRLRPPPPPPAALQPQANSATANLFW